MPGRVRQEGIDLYETGKLAVQRIENQTVWFDIAEERFCYSLQDEEISCSCLHFAQKGYCKHLAAVEYFVRNDAEGKVLLTELKEEGVAHQETVRRTYFGGLFLDKVLTPFAPKEVKYQLGAEGSIGPYDDQIDWTLTIRRLPDQRSYIVRDIGVFLKVIRQSSNYQIGKNYYEPISYEEFDEASQELLDFLMQLLPEKQVVANDILTYGGRTLRLPVAYFEEGLDLFQGLSNFQFLNRLDRYDHLSVLPYHPNLGFFAFEVKVHTRMIEMCIDETPIREILHGQYLLVDHTLYRLSREERILLNRVRELVPTESGIRKVQVDFQDQEKLALALSDLQLLGPVKAPKKFSIRDFQVTFYLSTSETGLELQTVLNFEGFRVSSQEVLENLPFTPHYHHLEAVFSAIEKLGFSGKLTAHRPPLSADELYFFFTESLAELKALGKVELAEELRSLVVEEKPQIRIEQSASLLEVSFDFAGIAEDEVAEAMKALMAQKSHFTSRTGRVLVFDEETQNISQTLQFLRAEYGNKGRVQLHRFASYQLAASVTGYSNVSLSTEFQQLAYDLTHPEDYPLPAVDVAVELRDYQQLGVKWLSMLDRYGFGGILADDMGLGKTLQTIAFLTSRLETHSRVLILAPASLIYNWQEEFHRFAPQLDVAVVYGNKVEREDLIAQGHQILVTSYASFRQDVESYKQQMYDYLILDEAQVMKNAQTKIAQQLRDFEVKNAFALSGTPIENHLSEIWSIFQIILPGLLPDKTQFGKLSAAEVARIIKPFVLRRRKEEVLFELPDLIEINVLNELSDAQKAIYLAQLEQMQASIKGASEAEINHRKIEILSGITRLRQICDTPKLFMDDYAGDSGKLDSLRDLLLQLKEGNHRVLIFSQFRNMLDLIEEDLTDLGLTSYKLTGSTPASDRQEMTRAFNAGSRDAFLISLKAGGVGLNLTGADTVILVDLWWNPAVEAQAISRAHRMGQTETVEFYRLITRGTIEEKIQALQETKKNLVTTVLDGNESRANMTVQEIKEILGIS